MIDSLKSEEPGTFSHVRGVRVDRQVDRRGLVELHGTPHPLIFLTVSTGAVLTKVVLNGGRLTATEREGTQREELCRY